MTWVLCLSVESSDSCVCAGGGLDGDTRDLQLNDA